MTEELKPGDRVRFTIGEGKFAYTGYGRVVKTTHGATIIAPEGSSVLPPGLKFTNIEKVDK